MSDSDPTRLLHPRGANVDNPKPVIAVLLEFEEGQWFIREMVHPQGHHLSEYHWTRDRRVQRKEVEDDVLDPLLDALGMIRPAVVRRNYQMWLEALQVWTTEKHRRVVQKGQEELLELRKKITGDRHGK